MPTPSTYTRSILQANALQVEVPNPLQPLSNKTAGYYSVNATIVFPIIFSTTAYVTFIPPTGLITRINVVATTAFSGGSPTLAVGTTVGGVDLIAATTLGPSAGYPVFKKLTPAVNGQVFFTIGGVPTAGAGFLLLEFINPLTPVIG